MGWGVSREGWVGELPASKLCQRPEVSAATRADEPWPSFPLHTKIQDSTDAEQLQLLPTHDWQGEWKHGGCPRRILIW